MVHRRYQETDPWTTRNCLQVLDSPETGSGIEVPRSRRFQVSRYLSSLIHHTLLITSEMFFAPSSWTIVNSCQQILVRNFEWISSHIYPWLKIHRWNKKDWLYSYLLFLMIMQDQFYTITSHESIGEVTVPGFWIFFSFSQSMMLC